MRWVKGSYRCAIEYRSPFIIPRFEYHANFRCKSPESSSSKVKEIMLTLSCFSLYFKYSTRCEFHAWSMCQRLGSAITPQCCLLMQPYKQRKLIIPLKIAKNGEFLCVYSSTAPSRRAGFTPGTLQLHTIWAWIVSFPLREQNRQYPLNRTLGRHQRSTHYTEVYTLHRGLHITQRSTRNTEVYTLHRGLHITQRSTRNTEVYTLHRGLHITQRSTRYTEVYTLHRRGTSLTSAGNRTMLTYWTTQARLF
jgi:hypothetical protein